MRLSDYRTPYEDLAAVRCSKVQIDLNNDLKLSVSAIFDAKERIAQLPFLFSVHLADSTLYSSKTIPTYLSAILMFIRHVIENEETDHLSVDELLLSVNAYQVNHFLHDMRVREKSDNYICTCDAALKTFFQWLEINNAIHSSILPGYSSPYINNRSKAQRPIHQDVRHVNSAEVIAFLNHGFKDEHTRCALHFMFDTGVRISELLRFKVADFLRVPEELTGEEFIKLEVVSSKGRGGTKPKGQVFVSKIVFDRVKNLIVRSDNLNPSNSLFVDKRGKAIKASSLQQKIYRASNKLLAQSIISKKITAHMFRHGTAFSLLKFCGGYIDIQTLIHIRQILRHKSIRSIENYISINFIEIKADRENDFEKGIHSRLLEAKHIFNNTSNY